MAKLLRFRKSSFSSLSSHSETNLNNNLSTIISNRALYLLQCCKTSIHLYQIQSHLITTGLFRDPSFADRVLKLPSSLIDDSGISLLIFKNISYPDAFCFNTVIKKYSCSKHLAEAVGFYIEKLRTGEFFPNGFTFPPLISSCAKLGCLSSGQMCHGQAVKFGVSTVLQVQNSLIHFYACFGLLDVVHEVLVEMPVKDVVMWNAIVDGFAKNGEMGIAHKLFDGMPEKSMVSLGI